MLRTFAQRSPKLCQRSYSNTEWAQSLLRSGILQSLYTLGDPDFFFFSMCCCCTELFTLALFVVKRGDAAMACAGNTDGGAHEMVAVRPFGRLHDSRTIVVTNTPLSHYYQFVPCFTITLRRNDKTLGELFRRLGRTVRTLWQVEGIVIIRKVIERCYHDRSHYP